MGTLEKKVVIPLQIEASTTKDNKTNKKTKKVVIPLQIETSTTTHYCMSKKQKKL